MKITSLAKVLPALFLSFLTCFAGNIAAQTTITKWTFENAFTLATPEPAMGTGTASIIGSMTGGATAAGFGNCNASSNNAGGGWQIGTANPGTTNESSGVQYLVSTVGYEDIKFAFDHRLSNTATRTRRIQYTLDGTNWVNFDVAVANLTINCANQGGIDLGRIDASNPTGSNAGDRWTSSIIDLSSITGADNNPNFGIRIVAAHYAATGQFRQANNVGTVATGGTWRFDNVTISGTSTSSNTPPTITENTASPFVNLNATGAGSVSGVINNLTDPAATLGIDFTINDAETAVGSLSVTAFSSNTSVVPNNVANLVLTGTGATRNLKIVPVGIGFAMITVTVTDGGGTPATYIIDYAVSATALTDSRFHTSTSDASTAIAIDADYMLVADDEDQTIRLYDRNDSGLPLAAFDFTSSLGLTDINSGVPREVDIEASTRVGNRIYWLASQGNSSGGGSRPNRRRIFATDISGTGAATTLTYVGRYDGLRTDLLNWDASNTHGLGANYFGLTASASTSGSGVAPEAAGGIGFNIEGLVFAPGSTTTAYVAFRAPIVPASARTKALIVPVTNFDQLVTGNPSAGPATFGTPIQLDLGGLGIRSIEKNAANEYLIIAGPASGTGDFKFYTWTGIATDAPIERAGDLSFVYSESAFESIVEVPNPLTPTSSIQVLMDNGDRIWYGSGPISKDLNPTNHQKFRSDVVLLGAAIIPTVACPVSGIVYVNDDASGTNDGSTWTNAYNDLQDALTLACNCTGTKPQIWVAAGTYYPDEGIGQTDNARASTFQLCNGVAIYGGFNGTENSLSLRNVTANLTTLSGDLMQNDGANFANNGENAYHVVTGSGTDMTARIDGFTITAGKADGGGVNNLGGGMYNDSGSPTVANCTFSGNSANAGGGMYNLANISPSIINCSFSGNAAQQDGGGMYNRGSSPSITNSIFSGNIANRDGGGMYNYFQIPIITNCTFSGNMANRDGGGMYNDNSSPSLTNTIIWNNRDNTGIGTATSSIFNTLFSPTITYSLVQGQNPAGTGNKNGTGTNGMDTNYPDFVTPIDPTTAPTTAGNLRLQTTSPAVNMGNNAAVPNDTKDVDNDGNTTEPTPDLDLEDRILQTTVDMGAYEQLGCPTGSNLILYVNTANATPGDGTTWASAYNDLQDALSFACNCPNVTQIWVAAGIYYPDEGIGQTDNASASTFQLCNGVAVYGGFNGTENSLSLRNVTANLTTLSGDLMKDDVAVFTNNGENALHVVTGSGTNNTARIDGFTVSGGNADGSGSFNDVGGGMFNNVGSPIVANCTFSGNSGTNSGGGMYNYTSSPSVINCMFVGNLINTGGGMFNQLTSTPSIINCTFAGNSARLEGGGMYNARSSPTITNSTFSGNSAALNGGGGGMYNAFNSAARITNTIIWNNRAGSSSTAATASIANNGSIPIITYSLVQSITSNDASGNKDGITNAANSNYPAFVTPIDPTTTPTTAGNLRLQSSSLAINMGSNAALPMDVADLDQDGNTTEQLPLDLDLNPRIFNDAQDIVDMGAYEAACITPAGTISASATTICVGEQVQLTFTATPGMGTGPFDIVVNGVTYNDVVSGSVFATLTPANNTTYTLTQITDDAGCVASSLSQQVSVVLNIVSGVNIEANQVICAGEDPAPLTTVPVPAFKGGDDNTEKSVLADGTTYRWESSTTDCTIGFTTILGETNETYDPPALTVTTYYRRAKIRTLNGVTCERTSNCVTITVNPIPTATVTAISPICQGENAVFKITATPNTTVFARLNGGSPSPSPFFGADSTKIGASGMATLTIVNPAVNQTLTLYQVANYATSYFGTSCRVVNINESATVVVSPKPNINANATQNTICAGDTTTLNFTPTTDLTVVGWFLDDAGAGCNPTGSSLSMGMTFDVYPTTTTRYAVVVQNRSGCRDTACVNITVNPLPTITLGANPAVCQGTTSTTLLYTATTGSPNQYSINFTQGAMAQGFVDVGNTALVGGSITIGVPAGAAPGTYTGRLRVRNSTTGCRSERVDFTITINPNPTITLGANPIVCTGETSANLAFTATTGNPNQYSINFADDSFTDVTNGVLGSSPIVIAVPANAAVGTYTATLTIGNSTTNCGSQTYNISVSVLNCNLVISDPCSCKNNATTLINGQFNETVSITAPSGQTWTVSMVSNLYQTTSPAPPAAPTLITIGTAFVETPNGDGTSTYTLVGLTVDATTYNLTATNGTISRSISNQCFYPNPAITGLDPAYCEDEPAVTLTGTIDRGDGQTAITPQSAVFDINGTVATQFDPQALGAGSYSVNFTVDAAAEGTTFPGCVQAVSQQVRVDPQVTVNAGRDATICRTKTLALSALNASVQYSGTIADLTYTWSFVESGNNGTLTGTSSTDLNAGTFTPGPDAIARGFVTLRLTVDNPNDACAAVSDTVRVTIQNVDCGQFPWNGN